MSLCADAAVVGAAVRAAHGWVCEERGEFVPFAQIVECGVVDSALKLTLVAEGRGGGSEVLYGRAVLERMALEGKLLEEFGKV